MQAEVGDEHLRLHERAEVAARLGRGDPRRGEGRGQRVPPRAARGAREHRLHLRVGGHRHEPVALRAGLDDAQARADPPPRRVGPVREPRPHGRVRPSRARRPRGARRRPAATVARPSATSSRAPSPIAPVDQPANSPNGVGRPAIRAAKRHSASSAPGSPRSSAASVSGDATASASRSSGRPNSARTASGSSWTASQASNASAGVRRTNAPCDSSERPGLSRAPPGPRRSPPSGAR